MDFRKGILILALSVALPAFAEIRTLIDSMEIRPSDMTVPTSLNSRVSYRTCLECKLDSARLTPETTFRVRGEQAKFADFRLELVTLRQRNRGYTLLSVDTRTGTILSIHLAD